MKLLDFTRPFFVEPHASDVAVGVVLLQQYNDGLNPVVYFSKKYVTAKKNYAPYDKKLLAIFKAC